MEYTYTQQPTGQIATSGNTESLRFIPEVVYVALVVDVIFDQYHPSYSEADGYSVGSVKVRILEVDNSVDSSQLSWAQPMDMTSQQLPLVGELVLCHKIFSGLFYTKAVPLAKRLQENGMLYLNEQLVSNLTQTLQEAVQETPELANTQHKFGRYFKPDSRVRQLMHFEGDYVLQGRMGHSIRFGSSKMDPSTKGMAPNIILRAGQAPGADASYSTRQSVFGLTIEDINKDASSIWMTSDQVVPFMPSTKDASSFMRSVDTAPQIFDGASIIINSNRVILNSKKSSLLIFSNAGIHINSFQDTTIDTDGSIKLSANLDMDFKSSRNVNFYIDEDFAIKANSDISLLSKETLGIVSKKIYLGSVDNDDEPIVGGTTLAKFLARLILAFTKGTVASPPESFTEGINSTMHVVTPMGPGRLSPAVVMALQKLYSELASKNPGQKNGKPFAGAAFNSEANFVKLQNDEVELQKNEYKEGKPTTPETSTWVLADDYYKIV